METMMTDTTELQALLDRATTGKGLDRLSADTAIRNMALNLAADVIRLTAELADARTALNDNWVTHQRVVKADATIAAQTEAMGLMMERLEAARQHIDKLLDEVGSYDPDWALCEAARAWLAETAGAL